MVSSVPFDVLADPEVAIQDVFDQHIQSQSSEEFSKVLGDHFKKIFEGDENTALIPHLNASYLEPSSSSASTSESKSSSKLVQFRGMVQDTSSSPELYLSILREGKYGGWGAQQVTDGQVDYSTLRECTRYWVVSVPGESAWTRVDRSEPTAINAASAHKFPIPSTPHIGIQVKIYSPQAQSELKSTDIATFVGLLEIENEIPTLHALYHVHESAHNKAYGMYPMLQKDATEKAGDSAAKEEDSRVLQSELISWIADEALAGDKEVAEWVLLCAIARVQSRNPPILPASLTISRFPPPSHVDTSPPASTKTPSSTPPSEATSSSPDPSSSSSSTETKLTFNNVPTIYHILSLLFPIVTSIPLTLPLLNDGAFAPESKPLPRSEHGDDDPDDELHSGVLQLVQSTLCVVTDSGITEGTINDRGIRNLRALQEVIRHQTLEYVFPYSGFRFETDIGFVVCTEGQKSALVETHVTVPLRPDVASTSSSLSESSSSATQRRLYKSPEDINLPPSEKLEAWRKLIGGAMARQLGLSTSLSSSPSSSGSGSLSEAEPVPVGGIGVSDAAADYIQDEFVKERQAGAQKKAEGKSGPKPAAAGDAKAKETEKAKGVTTPDDLIHRMLMAKLLALSLHEPEVTVDVWERMKRLETRRLARVA